MFQIIIQIIFLCKCYQNTENALMSYQAVRHSDEFGNSTVVQFWNRFYNLRNNIHHDHGKKWADIWHSNDYTIKKIGGQLLFVYFKVWAREWCEEKKLKSHRYGDSDKMSKITHGDTYCSSSQHDLRSKNPRITSTQ